MRFMVIWFSDDPSLNEQTRRWMEDPSVRPWKLLEAHRQITVPNLDFTGWFDHCCSIENFLGLRAVAVVPVVVFHLSAVHYQDDLPIQLESRYVNPAAMPHFMEQDFSQTTATAYLLEQFKPDEMEHRVCAMMPDAQICELLAMPGGQPCLQLTRRTWRQQQVVTYVILTYPGDRYELGARYATNEYQLR